MLIKNNKFYKTMAETLVQFFSQSKMILDFPGPLVPTRDMKTRCFVDMNLFIVLGKLKSCWWATLQPTLVSQVLDNRFRAIKDALVDKITNWAKSTARI